MYTSTKNVHDYYFLKKILKVARNNPVLVFFTIMLKIYYYYCITLAHSPFFNVTLDSHYCLFLDLLFTYILLIKYVL